jgi:hypothetical protein
MRMKTLGEDAIPAGKKIISRNQEKIPSVLQTAPDVWKPLRHFWKRFPDIRKPFRHVRKPIP